MTDQNELSALRRKAGAGRAPSDGAGMTPAKAFRLAISKAAEVELGLAVRVQSFKEQPLNQAQLLEALDGDALLVMLEGPEDSKGVAVFDMQVLSALIEVQTLGQVIRSEAKPRPPTRTDSAMCEATLDRVLQDFEGHLADGSSAVWATGFQFQKQIGSLRLMGLALEDVPYRLFDLQLDLADGAKQGVLQIALPALGVSHKKTDAGGDDGWSQAMENTVGDSHVEISAVLHRVHKSLAAVQALQVGDEIVLPQSCITAVSMEGTDGCIVGVARLGQKNGYRALRMTDAQASEQAQQKAQPLLDPVAGLPASDASAMGFPAADIPNADMAAPMDGIAMEPLADPMAMPAAMDAMAADVGAAPMPDLPMMPMESAPLDGLAGGDEEIGMATPMAAMPMDIEIA